MKRKKLRLEMEIFFPYAQDISMQISRNNVNNLKDLMCEVAMPIADY